MSVDGTRLERLAEELRRRAPDGVTLTASLLGQAPAGFDVALRKAFRLGLDAGLPITFGALDVGRVVDAQFTVTNAHVSFLGYEAAKSDVTLRFREGSAGPEVLIAVELVGGWTFATTFPYMQGWPFDVLAFTNPTFVFSTVALPAYRWRDTDVALHAGQNFVGFVAPPARLGPTLELAQAGEVADRLTIAGPVSIGGAYVAGDPPPGDTAATASYPDMDLRARIGTADISLFDLIHAREPAIGLRIAGVSLDVDSEPPMTVYEQTPELYFGARIDVDTVALDLRTYVMPSGSIFGFSLSVGPDSPTRLTPAAAAALLGAAAGSESLLGGAPEPLQAMFASVGLEALTLTGKLPPDPRLASISVAVGTAKGRRHVLFGEPGGRELAIDSLTLVWTVLDPLSRERRRSLTRLTTNFTFWPSVFAGGFGVEIDQDLRVSGSFDGTADFRDIARELTGGALVLPEGLDAAFSDVRLDIDPRARSYSLACTVDAEVDLLRIGDRPVFALEGMRFVLGAFVPAASGTTAFRGHITGGMSIGPVAASVDAAYEGGPDPVWRLGAELAEPLPISDLISRFLAVDGYEFPSFLPQGIAVEGFSASATLPGGESSIPAEYAVATALSWRIPEISPEKSFRAEVGVQYSGSKVTGSVVGKLPLADYGLLEIGYRFGEGTVLWVAWMGVRGEYDVTGKRLKLRLAGWTAGGLIRALVRTLGDPYFELQPPWDFLERVSLDGLELTIDFGGGDPQFSASWPVRLDLGFLTIDRLHFAKRRASGEVTLAIEGHTGLPGLDELFTPGRGQSVRDMPDVPGQGSQWFELGLLVLGQRVGIAGAGSFTSVKDAIDKLGQVPPTDRGSGNPVGPSASATGQPFYDPGRGWLAALHFGVLKVGSTPTFDFMIVFADGDFYGLRLAFNGQKAKALDGLSLDVLYKKVTDEVGVFQAEISVPNALRMLDFGAFAITLPRIGIRVYTNGDFLFDFGFPYGLDFSRSFGLQAIVYGVPVLGSAGFYIGRLSAGVSAELPQNAQGTFSPAAAFGLGLELGVGRYVQKGPLRAGFSITVFGVVEGTIASWTPAGAPAALAPGAEDAAGALAALATGAPVQGDYFFRLRGTFGIIGKLTGDVDFTLARASVDLTVKMAVQATVESFADIPLKAWASVSVKLALRINLGLFSINLSFSYDATIEADVTIESPSHNPPWYGRRALAAGRRPVAALDEPLGPAQPKMVRGRTPVPLPITTAPQFTVLAPQHRANPGAEEGAFVLLFAIDAPTANGEGNREGSSFEALCAALLPWVIDALTTAGAEVDLDVAARTPVSREQLETFVARLRAHPIGEKDIETLLLLNAFEVSLAPAREGSRSRLEGGATIFPAFSGLSMRIPHPAGTGDYLTVKFREYVSATGAYRPAIDAFFDSLAPSIDGAPAPPPRAASWGSDEYVPMTQLVFEDWFSLVARQLLQACSDALGDYAYAPKEDDSLASIAAWAAERGNAVGAYDVAVANAARPVTPGVMLRIPARRYVVQAGQSLDSVVARYPEPGEAHVTPATLVVLNRDTPGLVAAGVELSIGERAYRTQAGDSFAAVAAALGIALEELGDVIRARGDLLAPTSMLEIPEFDYRTDEGNTLDSICALFDTTLAELTAIEHNVRVAGLFGYGPVRIAGLERLTVADLWEELPRTGKVGQIAGMVARFQLHGMRLPQAEGLGRQLSFLYGGQEDWGLFQLTGQQFPTPPFDDHPTYAIVLEKDPSLDFLRLGYEGLARLEVDLSAQARELHYVFDRVRAEQYAPAAEVALEPPLVTSPRRHAVERPTPWATSEVEKLVRLTRPPGGDPEPFVPQLAPVIWDLPAALQRLVADRGERLARHFSPAEARPFFPLVSPQVQVGDSAPAPLRRFAAATRIELQVKRLAQHDDEAPARPEANAAVPPGEGNSGAPRGLAPFTYELVAPRAADAVRLERLLAAMASRGEDFVTGAFLLYDDKAAEGPGLTSRTDDELIAFVTRTNLTTETAPALRASAVEGAESGDPRGILNSPAELVRMMWELSTVRSGGYYLHYERFREAAGLPAAAFDASGTATLTLVLTYAREAADQDGLRLADYANAVVTTEPLEVSRALMTLESGAAPAASAPLAGTETLAELAALYGADLAELARLNAGVELAHGTEIALPQFLHTIDAADGEGGDLFQAVAARVSAAAKTPLTGSDLYSFNPGIDLSRASGLMIPPLTYVSAAADERVGRSLGSVSRWYGIALDALAHAAAGVPGLFAAQTVLTVDSAERVAQPRISIGNAALAVTRATPPLPRDLPPQPTPADADAFAAGYLESLYTMLAAGIRGGRFFRASPFGLPFGPRTGADPAQVEYSQTLGFRSYAELDPRPRPGPEPVEPRGNPYAGIGTVLQLDLRWRDVFGNELPAPYRAGHDGRRDFAGPPVPPLALGYTDRPIGVGSWPNVRAEHIYRMLGGRPELDVVFTLATAAYADEAAGTERARADLAIFTRVASQLSQDYTNAGVPGVGGRAVTMRLACTLLATPESELTDSEAQQVRDFVDACAAYLRARAAGEQAGSPPPTILRRPVAPESVSADDVIPLSVSFTVERAAELTDPVLRALPGGLSDTTEILPAREPGADVSLAAFARLCEEAFDTPGWRLRVGTSAGGPGQGEAGGELWAVRIAKAAGAGLGYQFAGEPSFYAPRPLATALRDGEVEIDVYERGHDFPARSERLAFAGVDMNTWAQGALAAIDSFLSAGYASPAYLVDMAGGEQPGYFDRILEHKRTLAAAIGRSVEPVLTTSATDERSRAAAGAKLEQALLAELGAAFTVSAVTVVQVDGAGARRGPRDGEVAPPRFYGQPLGGQRPGEAGSHSLSTAKVPLRWAGEPATSHLAFLFGTSNAAATERVPLKLSYAVSHLEHDIRRVPGVEDYESSRWISFVTGPFVSSIPGPGGAEVTEIPVVLRALPQPPSIAGQHVVGGEGSEPPAELARWSYRFDYIHRGAAQDSLTATVEFGRGEPLKAAAPPDELFAALAQFTAAHPAIEADLEEHLRPIDAKRLAEGADVRPARAVLHAFEAIVGALARAYDAWSRPAAMGAAAMVGSGAHVTHKYVLDLEEGADGRARVDVHADAAAPPAHVAIDPERLRAEPTEPGGGARWAWEYAVIGSDPPRHLSYAEALALPERRVTLGSLDAFARQDAHAALEVFRNRRLVRHADTTPAFQFATPAVRFADRAVPLLAHDAVALRGTGAEPKRSLEGLLDAFFRALFVNAEGQRVGVKVDCSYTFEVSPGLSPAVVPIAMMPAVDYTPAGTTPAFVPPLARAVDSWLAASAPPRSPASALRFAVEVFGAPEGGQSLPLVTIRDLHVALDELA